VHVANLLKMYVQGPMHYSQRFFWCRSVIAECRVADTEYREDPGMVVVMLNYKEYRDR